MLHYRVELAGGRGELLPVDRAVGDSKYFHNFQVRNKKMTLVKSVQLGKTLDFNRVFGSTSQRDWAKCGSGNRVGVVESDLRMGGGFCSL